MMADSAGQLGPGGFVRLAYRLGRQAVTGSLEVRETPRIVHEVFLRRGYVVAAHLSGDSVPLGEVLREAGVTFEQVAEAMATGGAPVGRALRDRGLVTDAAVESALRRQAESRLERLAAMPHASFCFTANATPPAAQRTGRPVSLTAWSRRHIEARLDSTRARLLAIELRATRLGLRRDLVPEHIDCDTTDRRILEALGTPRSLDEIERLASAPRFRLLAFLHFLRTVGACVETGARTVQETRAHLLLGVPAGADPAMIKQAYRRLARQLHPDMHPEATASARRDLEDRFVQLTEAVSELLR
jgi:hypothetical protein